MATTATVCQRPVSAAEPETDERQDDAGDAGDVDRQLAGGDRAEPLGRVEPVGFDVEQVVPEVDAAGGEAERGERDQRQDQFVALVEDAGRARGGEHEDVLQPLLRPSLLEQRPQHAAPPVFIGARR